MALGFCKRHYRHFKRYGDPLIGDRHYQQFTDTTKVCFTCKAEKPLDQFSPARRNRSGRASSCRRCQNVRVKKWVEHRTAEQKAKDSARRTRRTMAAYNLTAADYDALLAAQGGGCICGKTTSGHTQNRRFHVDHDHRTGNVRGVLCHGCNTAIGLAGEDADRLRLLASYLDRHQDLPARTSAA